MRLLTLTFASLALLGAGATTAAQAKTQTFNVSLYGVQRFTDTQVEKDIHPDNCFGAQGTTTSRSVVRFHTAKPIRVKATRSGSYVNLQWPDTELEIPVIADWEHSGSSDRAQRSCLLLDDQGFQPDPPREEKNCHKTLDDRGYSLTMSGGKVEVTGDRAMIGPLDPFNGCPWGDMSLELYPAKARVRAAIIMDGAESELTLRGREHSHTDNPDGSGSSDTVKQTTVYVVFKRR
jgi:hypothetical protein